MEQLNQTVSDEQNNDSVGSKPNKRFYVIQEIISTELTYVDRLRITLDCIVNPIKSMKILSPEDIVNQFDCLEEIYHLHTRNPIDGSASQNLKFIDLFNDISANLQTYSNYLVNYEPAMQRRGHLLISNRRFSDFLEKQEKDPILQSQSLESLLILPVQRIPRYRLLLEQLLKYTPDTHPDYPIVKDALEKICDLAMYNNEAIRARENKNKIMSIMMQLEPTTRVDLLDIKDRKFIKEGSLLRQCRRRYKEFQFWLFSDELLYGEKTALGLFTLHRQISLKGCQVVALSENDPDVFNGFIIASSSKSFKVKTKGDMEKKEWMDIISETIKNYKKDNQGDEHNVIAPIWKPDINSSHCEICQAVFTLIFRRHHCRNCGKLVCDNCSAKRFHLPHVDESKHVRVCDPCFSMLSAPTETNKDGNGKEKPFASDDIDPFEDDEEDDDDTDDEDRGFSRPKSLRQRSVAEDDLHAFNEFVERHEDKIIHSLSQTLDTSGGDSGSNSGKLSPTPPPKPPKPVRRTILTSQPQTPPSVPMSSQHYPSSDMHSSGKAIQRPTLLPRISLADLAAVALRPIGHLLPTKDSFPSSPQATTSASSENSREGVINVSNPVNVRAPRRTNIYQKGAGLPIIQVEDKRTSEDMRL